MHFDDPQILLQQYCFRMNIPHITHTNTMHSNNHFSAYGHETSLEARYTEVINQKSDITTRQ
jgi:hypothetical protein